MNAAGIAAALARAGLAPCERYRCHQRANCAASEVCCDAFAHYVKTGRTASPFIRMHSTWTGEGERQGQIEATADKFARMTSDGA